MLKRALRGILKKFGVVYLRVNSMEDKKKYVEDIMVDLGLMHDHSEMIDDEEVKELIGGLKTEYYERAPEFGNRAHKAIGNKKTLILWDCGNGWYQIVTER